MKFIKYLVAISGLYILLGYCNAETPRANSFDIEMSSGEAITISQFGNTGNRFLWIPSEYGVHKDTQYPLLNLLAQLNQEAWLAELHESYFIPPGRSSLTKVPLDDLVELIEKSVPEDDRKFYLVSSGRGAVLTTMGIQAWQAKTGGSKKFGGVIFISPNFQAGAPAEGKSVKYLSLVDSAQLPIYILQPKKSSKYYYLKGLVNRLNNSGSQVYTKIIKHVADGYYAREDAEDIEKKIAK